MDIARIVSSHISILAFPFSENDSVRQLKALCTLPVIFHKTSNLAMMDLMYQWGLLVRDVLFYDFSRSEIVDRLAGRIDNFLSRRLPGFKDYEFRRVYHPMWLSSAVCEPAPGSNIKVCVYLLPLSVTTNLTKRRPPITIPPHSFILLVS